MNSSGDGLRYKFGELLHGELMQSEDPYEMFMSLEPPLDYRQAFYPGYPHSFPVYFSGEGEHPSRVEVLYLDDLLPPVFDIGIEPEC